MKILNKNCGWPKKLSVDWVSTKKPSKEFLKMTIKGTTWKNNKKLKQNQNKDNNLQNTFQWKNKKMQEMRINNNKQH